jgi:hypothetical protein
MCYNISAKAISHAKSIATHINTYSWGAVQSTRSWLASFMVEYSPSTREARFRAPTTLVCLSLSENRKNLGQVSLQYFKKFEFIH